LPTTLVGIECDMCQVSDFSICALLSLSCRQQHYLIVPHTGFGAAKLTLKTKSSTGIALKAEESRSFANGAVSASVEIKHVDPLTGLNVKETWDTKNVITTEVSNENKLFHGHKFVAAYTCFGSS